MGVSTHKKVLITRFDREPLSGFVNPQGYLLAGGLELLTQSGSVSIVPFDEVKLVCFVRDFQQGEPRKELRLFTTRPKLEGLWLRMYFRDGDCMDGILSNNLLQLDSYGFSVRRVHVGCRVGQVRNGGCKRVIGREPDILAQRFAVAARCSRVHGARVLFGASRY